MVRGRSLGPERAQCGHLGTGIILPDLDASVRPEDAAAWVAGYVL